MRSGLVLTGQAGWHGPDGPERLEPARRAGANLASRTFQAGRIRTEAGVTETKWAEQVAPKLADGDPGGGAPARMRWRRYGG